MATERISPFAPAKAGDGVTVAIRVKPGAGRGGVRGLVAIAGGVALDVAVTAPPADGRANDAVIATLAKEWRLPKSALSIAIGHKARQKIVRVDGETADLLPRLTAWLSSLPVRF